MKTTFNFLMALSICIVPFSVSAEAGRDVRASTTRKDLLAELREKREEFRTERASVTAEMRAKRASTTQAFREQRASTTAEMRARNASMTAKLRADVERFKTELKEGLAKIKDETKRKKAERIANSLPELNARLTAEATINVNKIEAVSIAVESRTDKVAAGNANVSTVRPLIAAAKTAIADAKSAIALQSTKVYSINITSDATVKATLEAARTQMKTDIDTMNAKVKAARDAVKKASDALRSIPNVNATTTASTIN